MRAATNPVRQAPRAIEKFAELQEVLGADFYRYGGKTGVAAFLFTYFSEPGARYTFWLRVAGWLKRRPLLRPLFFVAWVLKNHYEVKFGFSIPIRTRIGPGLYFSHYGGIVVNGRAVIGRNCNISHGVTIGESCRGAYKGYPKIGDNVFVGPGAKIIGSIRVGSFSAIGANAVVVADVPEGAVAAGIPAKVISMEGSEGYVKWTA